MLDIIYRSCSRKESQVHGGTERIFNKPELTITCLKSIVNSAKNLDIPYKIAIVDDHSDLKSIAQMSCLISDIDHFFLSMEETGNGDSLKACFKYADDNCNDLIYFVEDDYLHEPEALPLMVEAYYNFKSNLGGKEAAIFPLDCNDRYKPDWMEPCYLVPGKDRYWRTINHTTCTFLIHKNIFDRFRSNFSQLTLYGIDPNIHECNTINRIWTAIQGAVCFSPILSLAYHIQLESHLPLYTDWKKCLEKINA